MLLIDLSALREGPIDVAQAVPTSAPCFSEIALELVAPVQLSGRLVEAGPGQYYWRGKLETLIRGACRRCLVPIEATVSQQVSVLFTEDDQAEDPSAYPIPPRGAGLDLGDAVREELVLAAPDYLLCREDCRGICPRCGTDLNEGKCDCKLEADPRWKPLEALKSALHGPERK